MYSTHNSVKEYTSPYTVYSDISYVHRYSNEYNDQRNFECTTCVCARLPVFLHARARVTYARYGRWQLFPYQLQKVQVILCKRSDVGSLSLFETGSETLLFKMFRNRTFPTVYIQTQVIIQQYIFKRIKYRCKKMKIANALFAYFFCSRSAF